MATTKSTSTRARSSTAKRAPRRRTSTAASRTPSLTEEAKTAVRSVRTRATRAAKKVPTDRTSLTVAAGVIAGIVAAGVALFMNRDKVRSAAATGSEKLRSAASTGGERLKKAADDLSTMAHERIDQARDNITKFRARANGSDTTAATTDQPATPPMAING